MQILDLEQGTAEWDEARLGKISGTRLSEAIGTKARQETLLNELIAENLTGIRKENFKSEAMMRGTEGEEYAIEEYCQMTGEITETVGMCVSDKYPWLTNSPDRLIMRDGKYRKAVEVKCPNTDTVVRYIRKGEIPYEYMGQVMSYFLVNEDLEELDFVIFDPRIQTEKYRISVLNVKREDLDLKEAEEDLLKFRETWVAELSKLNLSL